MPFFALFDIVKEHIAPYFWFDGQNLVNQFLHALVFELNGYAVPTIEQFVPHPGDSLNFGILRLQFLFHAELNEVDQAMKGSSLGLHVCDHGPRDYVLTKVSNDKPGPMV